MTRADAIAIFAQEPAAMRFLNTTPERLAAMGENEFDDCVSRGAQFLTEMGQLQRQAGKILVEFKALKFRPCLANDLAHRAQRLRDLTEEFGHVQREKYFYEGEA